MSCRELIRFAAPALLVGFPFNASAEAAKRPNILFIMADDHAANAISAYGGRLAEVAPTPNIDRIGREGVRLDKCFVSNSICTPSRAVILTGQHGHLTGVRTLEDRFPGPQSGVPNVAEMLRQSGYETALFGKWHLNAPPWGFDYWKIAPGQGRYHNPVFLSSSEGIPYHGHGRKLEPTQGYYTDLVTDFALNWIEQRDSDKPFFLLLHHKAPHGKWNRAKRHEGYLDNVTVPEPESLWEDRSHRSEATRERGSSISTRHSGRNMVAHVQHKSWPPGRVDLSGLSPNEQTKAAYQKYLRDYLACVKAVDENVGKVLDYLERSGLSDDTLLIYTSDQGMFLGEHDYFDKRWMYEESMQMPFLAKWPGVIPPGSSDNVHLCSNLDFAQTFLDFAGQAHGPAATPMQGRSLRPVLCGQPITDWREALYYRYWMHLSHHDVPAHYGIRTDRYKLIFFYALPLDASLGRDYGPTTPGWELYDLEKDPRERNNIYNVPAYAPVVKNLTERLMRLKQQVGDEDDRYPELMRLRSTMSAGAPGP